MQADEPSGMQPLPSRQQSSFRARTLSTGTLRPGDIPDRAQTVDERFGPCAPIFRTLFHAEPLI
jgi:hypothetical protein